MTHYRNERPSDGSADRLVQAQRLLAQGDLTGAIADCRQVLQSRPEDPQTLGLLGLAYLRQGNLAEADRALTRALALSPEVPSLMNALAIVRMQQRDTAEAIRLFSECLLREPYDRDALGNLASL